jgi:hypothetical protein
VPSLESFGLSKPRLRQIFGSAFQKGLVYSGLGKVQRVSYLPLKSRVEAEVEGSDEALYRLSIRLTREGSRVDVDSDCECPVGYLCKHAAAALVHLLEQGESTPARGGSDWAQWLDEIARLNATDTPAAQLDERASVRFLLTESELGTSPRKPLLRPLEVRVGRDGRELLREFRLGTGTQGLNLGLFGRQEANWLREWSDLPWINQGGHGWRLIDAPDALDLLRELAAQARLHWHALNAPPLKWMEGRALNWEWALADSGSQQLRPAADGSEVLRIGADLLAIDAERAEFGLLNRPRERALIRALLATPPIPPDQAVELDELIAKAPPSLNLKRPLGLKPLAPEHIKPIPVLSIEALSYSAIPPAELLAMAHLLTAELKFAYGSTIVPGGSKQKRFARAEDGHVRSFERDPASEAAARIALKELNFARAPYAFAGRNDVERYTLPPRAQTQGLVRWLNAELKPALGERGFRIELLPGRDVELKDPVSALAVDLNEVEDGRWFDANLTVELDGRQIDLLPLLLDALKSGQFRRSGNDDFLIDVGHQTLLPVAREKIEPLLKWLEEIAPFLVAGKGVKLPKLEAALLATLDPERVRQSSEALARLIDGLRAGETLEAVEPPEALNATLRPYQLRGLAWLQFLSLHGLGGLLADDMGLGKTVQVIAHLLLEKQAGRLDRPALVVAPTSVLPNWRAELKRFAPTLKLLLLNGPDREQFFAAIDQVDVVLTSYALLPRDEEELKRHPFHVLVLDEAQAIKNPKSLAHQVARRLDTRLRLSLTGTPVENHLGELKAQFDVLMPGFLGSDAEFRRLYRAPIEKLGDLDRQQRLRRRIAPFLLRRTKTEVATELPPKTAIAELIELDPRQRELYESIRLTMNDKVFAAIAERGLSQSRITILDALLKLRQVCCDPRLLPNEFKRAPPLSAKLEHLKDLLPQLIEDGRRILLFSQFTSMLELIREALVELDIGYEYLSGETVDREAPVKRFQAGSKPVFLLSLKAGGVGLNLTAADTVIHFDPWWNPAVEEQATDRAYRIGQDKPVFVYSLIAAGTVEEKLQALKDRKRALADGLFDENGGSSAALDLDALRELLA